MSPDYYSIRNGALADDLRTAGYEIEIEHFGESGQLRKVTLTQAGSMSAHFMDTAELYWFLLGAFSVLRASKPHPEKRLSRTQIGERLSPLRELSQRRTAYATSTVIFENEMVAAPMPEEAVE